MTSTNNSGNKKLKLFWLIGLGLLGIFIFSGNDNESKERESTIQSEKSNIIIVCDGTNITENCELNGIQYLKYKYHPAEDEKYHFENNTTYTREIVGYCTLCNDGTYSPSCSTGSGTCSHHGGVAQWNAPVYETISHTEHTKVIDSPSVPEWYETVVK